MDENNTIVSPDEAKAEQEALAEKKAEEIRSGIVTELGLTEDESNKEFIDKLVSREVENRKKLSEAIGQKISWRDKAKGTKPPAAPPAPPAPTDHEAIRKQAEAATRATLDQEYLDEKQYPDEVAAEIKAYAAYKGVSARQAEKAPHIQTMITAAVAEGRVTEAALPRSPRSNPAPSSEDKMPDFDMSTEEGRKQYDDWRAKNRS